MTGTRAPALALSLALGTWIGLAGCGGGGGGNPGLNLEGFDLELSTELARMSLQAYQQLEDFEDGRTFVLPDPYVVETELFTEERFGGEDFFEDEPLPIGFVASAPDTLYVVFRGTTTLAEWLGNASASQKSYPYMDNGGETHRGFTSVYNALHDDVIGTVLGRTASESFANVYVTGHSLGGALAILAGPDLVTNASVDPVIYTYAAPRQGDPTFQERFGEVVGTSWRVVNENDLVPELPPATVVTIEDILPETFDYTHVKAPRYIRFGEGVDDPTELGELDDSHDLCAYHRDLCTEELDPEGCHAPAIGIAGCGA